LHQIRVHCQGIGHPLLGDDVYGGGIGRDGQRVGVGGDDVGGDDVRSNSGSRGCGDGDDGSVANVSLLGNCKLHPSARRVPLKVHRTMARQALHAALLGFTHPATGERLVFDCPPPPDFTGALEIMRNLRRVPLQAADHSGCSGRIYGLASDRVTCATPELTAQQRRTRAKEGVAAQETSPAPPAQELQSNDHPHVNTRASAPRGASLVGGRLAHEPQLHGAY
jgi:hypothetical protein